MKFVYALSMMFLALFYMDCESSQGLRSVDQETVDKIEATYSQFHREYAAREMKRIVQEMNAYIVCEFSEDYTRVTLKNIPENIRGELHRRICCGDYYLAQGFRVLSREGDTIEIELHLNFQYDWYVDIVSLSRLYDDPLQFIIDHRPYWCKREIIREFTKSKFLKRPEVINVFASLLQDTRTFAADQIAITEALRKAVTFPSVEKSAKGLLMQHEILIVLKDFLHEPGVWKLFQEIASKDGRLPRRFRARNYIEGIDILRARFKIEKLKYIISSLKNTELDHDILENILWKKYPSSVHALREIGEEKIGQEVLKQFKQKKDIEPSLKLVGRFSRTPYGGAAELSETAVLYSILKFIGEHTVDQSLFTDIVYGMIDVCRDKELEGLPSLGRVLAALKANLAVQMPVINDSVEVAQETSTGSVISSLLSRPGFAEYYWSKREEAYVHVIKNQSFDPMLRLFATRKSTKYVLADTSTWVGNMHKKYYSEKLCACLQEVVSSDEQGIEKIKKEAAEILYLRNLQQNSHVFNSHQSQ